MIKQILTKNERQERISQLTADWLEAALKLIVAGKQTQYDLETTFQRSCKDKGIDAPQDKDLRRRIVRDATSWLKLIAEVSKEQELQDGRRE